MIPLCSPTRQRIGASDTVIDCVTNGVLMCFNREPEPYVCKNPAFTGAESEFVSAEIDKLLFNGVVERVSMMPRCVSPLKVVLKKNGKFRLVCDLRYLKSQWVL